jgi:hypothetical protein
MPRARRAHQSDENDPLLTLDGLKFRSAASP